MITVVSGLPRSGTSMMMQMLQAGGVDVLTDGTRAADPDNPRGYYELERIKHLKADSSWLAEAEGRAIKVVSALLYDLPSRHEYRIVFMERDLPEVLASQEVMLRRRGVADAGPGDAAMARHFTSHLSSLKSWLAAQRNMAALYVHHRDVIGAPAPAIEAIERFLGRPLDRTAMQQVIDRGLHRQRQAPGSSRAV